MKRGEWVCDCFYLAKIVNIRGDGTLDLVLYDGDGNRIGRASPAMGGPRTFEPCCAPNGWLPIEKPVFPLQYNPRRRFEPGLLSYVVPRKTDHV